MAIPKKKPAPRKPTALRATAPSKVNVLPTNMQVERWDGKTWRGQKFRIRITDTHNGQTLFQGESYADARDRDVLFDRCVAMGMTPLTLSRSE